MDQMEEKLGAILNNPQMMQQIMAMAQTMSQSQPEKESIKSPELKQPPSSMPEIDLSMVKNLSGLANQNSISKEQRALLSALGPYLSRDRVQKLEKAMRAEKMARLASSFLGQGGLSFLTGR